MFIYKCDMCVKEIENEDKVTIEIRQPRYYHFELCGDCGGPLVSFLQIKELVPVYQDPELA